MTVTTPSVRCPWAKGEDYERYHDTEWGVPCRDRLKLFEKLCLEGQQAGLSWITVLRKREHYRACFFNFEPQKLAAMTDAQIAALLQDGGLIRNRLKLYAIRQNAQALLAFEGQGGNFVELLWSVVNGKTKVNHPSSMTEIAAQTEESQQLSKMLKKLGFNFVGPTICYAFMQSMGLVDDHLQNCPQKHS